MKKKYIFLLWVITLIGTSIYTYENPEKIEVIKHFFKEKNISESKLTDGEIQKTPGNSFIVEFSQVISFSGKTAFITYDEKSSDFNKTNLKIYYQNGNIFNNLQSKKLDLPSTFTTARNGGVKTIFHYNGKSLALISSLKNKCFYASIILLSNGKEIFNTKCLPDKNIDYNGLGSSFAHTEDKILISIGTPEQKSSTIRSLAQDTNSMFGKIIEIDKEDLNLVIRDKKEKISVKIFTAGHRNPQGLTEVNGEIFSVEHGPRGGDELNKIIEGKNYGWPTVSYGTKYLYDDSGKSYKISHEDMNFEEPLFALVPSVGISSLNNCPKILKNYYKKNCLMALSLYGNSQRPGRSIIIFLLNKNMDKIHSVEKIFLRDDLKLRHFVTNSKNQLFEDKNGNIYVSADKKGIYKLSFVDFRY